MGGKGGMLFGGGIGVEKENGNVWKAMGNGLKSGSEGKGGF